MFLSGCFHNKEFADQHILPAGTLPSRVKSRSTKVSEMITGRDLFVALIAITLTPGAFAFTNSMPVLGSTVFDWNSIPDKKTGVGSVRSFVKASAVSAETGKMFAVM
jgi:hypothetical protein